MKGAKASSAPALRIEQVVEAFEQALARAAAASAPDGSITIERASIELPCALRMLANDGPRVLVDAESLSALPAHQVARVTLEFRSSRPEETRP